MISANQKLLNVVIKIIDLVVLLVAMVASYYLRFYTFFETDAINITLDEYLVFFAFMLPVYYLLYVSNGLYKPRRKHSFIGEFAGIFQSNIVGFLIIMSLLFVRKELHYSRGVLFLFPLVNIVLMTMERGTIRYTLRRLRAKGYNQKNIIIIGIGELARQLKNKLLTHPELGYTILDLIDPKKAKELEHLDDVLDNTLVDELFIAIPLSDYDIIPTIIEICEKHGTKTQIIPDYEKYLPARGSVENLDGMPIINIRYVPLEEAKNRILKRFFDIVVSIIALVITSPILLISAIIIKFTSPGPIIFQQTRVGRDKKLFTMYKLRSMKVQKKEAEQQAWTTKDDPRKTKFGEFIRKTSIDELPQFYNVLKGDMSVIGPRPERPFFVGKFKHEIPKYMIKHHVRPGITGYAQVKGYRGDTSIKKRIELDIFYIENWTFWLDVKIFLLTILHGFINKNAY